MLLLFTLAMLRLGSRGLRTPLVVVLCGMVLCSGSRVYVYAGPIDDGEGVVRIGRPAQSHGQTKNIGRITPVAYVAETPGDAAATSHAVRTISHEVHARIVPEFGAPCPLGPCGPCPPYAIVPHGPGIVAHDPTQYPDEYLCDGGDRNVPFHFTGHDFAGLDTEDTIGQAVDEAGRRQLVASSKVCIYAPKFAAIRTVTSSVLDRTVEQPAGAHEGQRTAGYNTHLELAQETQHDRLQAMRVRERASRVDMRSLDGSIADVTSAAAHHHSNAAWQNLTFLQDGLFRQADALVLAYGVQAAGVWTRDQNPAIYAHDARGHEIHVRFRPQEYIGAEDRSTPGELRIVKLADVDAALPGDVITFTLRFDNLGDRELRDIVIVDNLTARLEYVAGSVSSELPGRLDLAPNGEGSSILTFNLTEPLKGKTGGVISFQCRVR